MVEIEQLLKWSSLKPAFTRGGYRMGLKILVSSGFLSLIYYEKSFTKCFFKQLQLHHVPLELKPIKATPLMKQSSTKPDLNIMYKIIFIYIRHVPSGYLLCLRL